MLMVLKRSHFDACIKQLADVSMVFFFFSWYTWLSVLDHSNINFGEDLLWND